MRTSRLARRLARRFTGAVLLAAVLAGTPVSSGLPAGAAPVRAGTQDCVDGWLPATLAPGTALEGIAALEDGSAVAVGSRSPAEEDRRGVGLRWDGSDWTTIGGPSAGPTHGLLSAAAAPDGSVWAVGFRQPKRTAYPLAARWDARGWATLSPPRPRRGGESLTAVDVDPTGGVWAVGVGAIPGTGRHAVAWHRAGGRWTRQALGLGGGTALTAVLARSADDVWAAGSRMAGGRIRPVMVHWNGSRWSRTMLPAMRDEAQLAGLGGDLVGDVWAVGWQRVGDRERPLVLQRTAGAWSVVAPPDLGGILSLLLDVGLDGRGRPWVVGTVYRDATDRFAGVAAHLDAGGWVLRPMPPGSAVWLSALDGDPAAGGWVTGRARSGSLVRQACDAVVVPGRPTRRGAARHRNDRWGASGRPVLGEIDDLLPRPVPGLRRVPPIPATVLPSTLVVRDIALKVGLALSTTTHGASLADLDRDGHVDIVLSEHARLPSVWLWRQGAYERQPVGAFTKIDRHDCAVGRIDPGPLPDLVCSVGADGGIGIKANELWRDIGLGAVTEVGASSGIADPTGRGRELALFDADGDGDRDLFSGALTMRYDGVPSPNRLFLNDGTGHFSFDPGSGLTSDAGAACAEPYDMDRDRDTDLAICGFSGGLAVSSGIVIYRNVGGRFHDVTRALGVRRIGEVDVAVGRLGGSSRPDLVQVSLDRIRVSLWAHGRYVPVYERAIARGRGVAVGDVNGDGADDIYLLLGERASNDPDVMLLNDGTGRSFTTLAVPSTSKGNPEDVIAFDQDGDGRSEFLVLNGSRIPGPVQLITFQPAGPARR